MAGSTVKVPSSSGGAFDCYLALPASPAKTPPAPSCSPAPSSASTRICAPSPTSSPRMATSPPRPTCSGARCPDRSRTRTPRTRPRGQPRLEKIKTGEADMADTLKHVRTLPQHNGRAVAMGFCYGGPYAILGPKRLGYDAGVSCHGSQMRRFYLRARRGHRAGLHHVGRQGFRRATRSARRLPGAGGAGRATSRSTSSPASITATCCRTVPRRSTPRRAPSRWAARCRSWRDCAKPKQAAAEYASLDLAHAMPQRRRGKNYFASLRPMERIGSNERNGSEKPVVGVIGSAHLRREQVYRAAGRRTQSARGRRDRGRAAADLCRHAGDHRHRRAARYRRRHPAHRRARQRASEPFRPGGGPGLRAL